MRNWTKKFVSVLMLVSLLALGMMSFATDKDPGFKDEDGNTIAPTPSSVIIIIEEEAI